MAETNAGMCEVSGLEQQPRVKASSVRVRAEPTRRGNTT